MIPEQEYFLMQRGIGKEYLYKNEVSDSVRSVIATQTKCRYILSIEVLNSKNGKTFGFYTPIELNRYNSHYNQYSETNSATLLFTIFDIGEHIIERQFQVNTTINPLVINEKDGGESRVNITSGFSAVTKAFKKGIKQLKKGVVKNNNKI